MGENGICFKDYVLCTVQYKHVSVLSWPQAPCNSFLRFFSGSFVFDINYEKL